MNDVIEPILRDVEAGRVKEAAAKVDAPAFRSDFDALNEATTDAVQAIERARTQSLRDLRVITRNLGVALALVGLLAIGLTVFTMLALRVWVLSPLDRVRADLRKASAQHAHETPIGQTGPTEIAELARDAEALRRALLREIDAASAARTSLQQSAPIVVALQQAMAPPNVALPGDMAVHGTTRAAAGVVAGDWWDAIPLESGALGVVIADVSGHDVEAGVAAVTLRSVVRTGLIAGLEPHRVMEVASGELRPHGMAVTAFIAIIEPDAGILSWANAGHHPPLILSRNQQVGRCGGTGPLLSPLGGSWHTEQMPFCDGDVCFAFTDGLVESLDSDGVELGAQGLVLLLDRLDVSLRADLAELTERVIGLARQRAQSWSADDITVLAFARAPGRVDHSPAH
jgi:serine phosphatase RsbU (regulator of sigma subunit)